MSPAIPLHHVAPPSRRAAAWLWLVVLAMWLAPLLGAVHAVVHVPGMAHASAAEAKAQPGPPRAVAAPEDPWVHRLFGEHASAGDCRMFDQLCHADGLHGVAALALPNLPPQVLVAWQTGESVARWAALFDARGPPAFR